MSFSDLPDDLENLTIPLNNVGDTPEGAKREEDRRRRRNNGTKCMSPSRTKRNDVSREQRLRMVKSLDNQEKSNSSGSFLTKVATFSSKSPNMKRSVSSNSPRERLRQRLQEVNYCDLDGSNHSSSHTGESTPRMRSKATLLKDDDDYTANESEEFAGTNEKGCRSRSKSQQRRSRSKRSTGISRKQPDTEDRDDSLEKIRSKSKNRIRSKSKTKPKRMSSKVQPIETEDETSTSLAYGSRRSRHRQSSDDNIDADRSGDSQSSTAKCSLNRKGRRLVVSRNYPDGRTKALDTSYTESLFVLQELKNAKKSTKTKKTPHGKLGDEEQSLVSHLESDRSKKRSIENDNLSQVTEERSNNYSEPQPILLQFDPSSGNNVRSVNQNIAEKTSESIHGLHGTISRLEITKLAGLPTFEKFNTTGSTSTTGKSLKNSSHHNSTTQARPKKQEIPRSSSCVSPTSLPSQTAGETPCEVDNQNVEWNFNTAHSSRQTRSTGNVGKNKFFNRKGKVDGLEKSEKPMKRSSDLGARTNSFGAMMRLGGRYKLRDYEDSGFGDGQSLLRS